jgi:hypothetical protein
MTQLIAYQLDASGVCIGAAVLALGTTLPQSYLPAGRWELGTENPIIGGHFQDGETFRAWAQPGEGGLPVGARRFHAGFAWVSVIDDNFGEPGVSGWGRV